MDALHIIGAGGIGCAVGYALRAAGVAVTFIDANPAKVAWGRQHGVAVDRLPPLSANFVDFADWQPPTEGTVLLCTKCYDNAAVLAKLPPSLSLIPIQNGFDEGLPVRPRIEGIASFVSECFPGRTHTRITRAGKLHLGVNAGAPLSPQPPHPPTPSPTEGRGGARQRPLAPPLPSWERGLGGEGAAEALAALLRRAPFRVVVVPDILPYKYTKLLYNAAISPLAAAAGLDNGDILRLPRVRALFFALLRENHAILARAGVPLGKVGPFHPDTVARILRRPWLAHALAWAFYPSLHGAYCSMFNDLPAGRTEIDNYNRHLIDLAGSSPCPLNRLVYDLVRRMEQERIPPHLAVLDGLLDRAHTCSVSPEIRSQNDMISGARR